MKFYHLTDLHLFSKMNIGCDVSSFVQESDQTAYFRSYEIISSAFKSIESDTEAGTVIITGDLTHNGDSASIREVAALMEALQKSGKRVIAFPASHDFKKSGDGFRFDENGVKQPQLDATTEQEAKEAFARFGLDQAVEVDERTKSFVSALDGNIRFIAINPICGNGHVIDAELFEWLEEQCKRAKEDGAFIFCGIHYPLISPSEFYSILGGGGSFTQPMEEAAQRLAAMGASLMLAGHTHIHSITSLHTQNGADFYQISTGSLSGYCPNYRRLELDAESKRLKVETRTVEAIETPDGRVDARQMTRESFLGFVGQLLEGLTCDISSLSAVGGGMTNGWKKLRPFSFEIKKAARWLNELTFGKVLWLVKAESGLKKQDIFDIRDERVVSFVTDTIASLFDGEQYLAPSNAKYKMAMSLIAVIESVLSVLHISLKKLTKTDTLSALFAPLFFNYGIDNLTAEIDLGGKADKREYTVFKSKKGAAIVAGTLLAAVITLPLTVPYAVVKGCMISVNRYKIKNGR